MMLVEQTPVPAAALPIAIFKDHMRLGSGFTDADLQDEMLAAHLRAAIAAIEARTGKILISRDFGWTLSGWRDSHRQPLPVAPVSAVTAVVLVDVRGAETTVPSTAWTLQIDAHRPHLLGLSGGLPAVPQDGSVRIGFSAGYGPAWTDLPADLAQAVLLLAAHFYEYRHAPSDGQGHLPATVTTLIAPFRTVRLFMGRGQS